MSEDLKIIARDLCEEISIFCQKTIQELEDLIAELSPPRINPELKLKSIEQKVALKKIQNMRSSVQFDLLNDKLGHSSFSLLFVIIEEIQGNSLKESPYKDTLSKKFGKLLNLVSELVAIKDQPQQEPDKIAILTIFILPCKTYPVVFRLDSPDESCVKSIDCTDEDSALLKSLVEKHPGENCNDLYPKNQMAIINHFLGLGFKIISVSSFELDGPINPQRVQVYLRLPS